MKKRLKLLLVDFDGVLSNGRFYHVPGSAQNEIGKVASGIIFNRGNKDLTDTWMRGGTTYRDIHNYVEGQAGIDARLLDGLLRESIKYMPINPSLLRFVTNLRSRGVVVSLFTNNMDIFDGVLRTHHRLDDHFDYIYSSSSRGQLKLENDHLVKQAASDAGASIDTTALVDDSPNSITLAATYGVNTFLYERYNQSQPSFEKWLKHEYEW